MKGDARSVNAMTELRTETREFLAQLRPEDLATLEAGVKLINSAMTVGHFMKWVIISLLGILAGIVMFGETVGKMRRGSGGLTCSLFSSSWRACLAIVRRMF